MNQELQFTKLFAWQKSHELTIKTYQIVKNFPKHEQFALSDQMRRCSNSIAANIAEGYSQNTRLSKSRYYSIARGSLTELQNHLLLAEKVKYIDQETLDSMINLTIEVHKLINGMLHTIKSWS